MPASDHFNGKTFFNPGVQAERGWLDVLRWQLTSRRTDWPDWVEITPQAAPPAPKDDGIEVTWINHSTFLLQTPAGAILTDPVFSARASPVSWAGPKRHHAPGVAFEALPKISTVLLSHDHYDHCDAPTLQRLAREHQPQFVAPLGHETLLREFGAARVVELDWWQTHELTDGTTVTLTPSQHWTRRRMGGTNRRLWGGFYLQHAKHRLWFAGDSAYNHGMFRDIATRCGAPDLALIPIGAYEPRWFMKTAHMNPAEAVLTHRDVGARRSLAMHWGCFQLTDEGREAPVAALEQARMAAGLDPGTFLVMTPGESLRV